MCLAIPYKLISVDGPDALAEAGGVRRSVRVDFIEDPRPGEYVLLHAGFAIERLRPEDARDSLAAWDEVQHAGR